MELRQYQVDAFSARVFEGNPAAVCPLPGWLDDALLQAIASENNLSETAFFVPVADGSFALRWFTPVAEVDLCGHATLASAHVLFHHLGYNEAVIRFSTRSGELRVQRRGDWLDMDFPAQPPVVCPCPPPLLIQGLGCTPVAVLAGEDYIAVLANAEAVRTLKPDLGALAGLDRRGVIITAAGQDCDFVSRFFAPRYGIPEDPVTGSAHCALTPYWAERLGRPRLQARQLSARGGTLECLLMGERVLLSGQAVTFMQADILLTCALPMGQSVP